MRMEDAPAVVHARAGRRRDALGLELLHVVMDGLQSGERKALDVAEFPWRRLICFCGKDGRTNAERRRNREDDSDKAQCERYGIHAVKSISP